MYDLYALLTAVTLDSLDRLLFPTPPQSHAFPHHPYPPLPTPDAACEREKRAKALADAFGVDPSAPDAHLSHWERNREANYTPEMLLYAKARKEMGRC